MKDVGDEHMLLSDVSLLHCVGLMLSMDGVVQVHVRAAAVVSERAVRVPVIPDRSEVGAREQAGPVPRDDLHVFESV